VYGLPLLDPIKIHLPGGARSFADVLGGRGERSYLMAAVCIPENVSSAILKRRKRKKKQTSPPCSIQVAI
jgi:hypothetical protein